MNQTDQLSTQLLELREHYENDLVAFAKYINPNYQYGEIHERVFRWLSDQDCSDHQLLLLPRGHLKSHCIAVWCVWQITKEPWSSVVYLSATEDLAKIQVYAIKNMLVSDEYQLLWPEMLHKEEGKREKWSADAINVDHPERKKRRIRDNTIVVKTVKSTAIGMHCSHLVLDDVVVPKFAYTNIGRLEVKQAVSQFASIKNPGAQTKAVGTRYHPSDLYSDFLSAEKYIWNDELQEFDGKEKLWDIWEETVEDRGDGTGNFLWPRVHDPITKESFGFDPKILASVRAQYESTGQMVQFYAQYYNDPNDPDSHRLSPDCFQYFDKKHLNAVDGAWYYKENRLQIFAAMDVAWTTSEKSDFTAIVVIGIDSSGFIYILDLDRFKTSNYSVYYERVMELSNYWGFRKMRVETNAGGKLVAQRLEELIRENGQALSIDGKARVSHEGNKIERHAAIVEPRYRAGTIFHYKGGYTPELEEEIVLERPTHDDLEDALCSAIEISKPPGKIWDKKSSKSNVVTDVRFGGVRGGRRR